MARWVVRSILHGGPIELIIIQPVLQDWCKKGGCMCHPVILLHFNVSKCMGNEIQSILPFDLHLTTKDLYEINTISQHNHFPVH